VAIWAIGDIQGCYDSLQKLLDTIAFDTVHDELWFVGDLVNRGMKSLEVLRFVYAHKKHIRVVLGNHDLSLLAAYWGIKPSNPTIDPVLQASDGEELIEWLRKQPFLHTDFHHGYAMAHAGISPEFDLGSAVRYARRIEAKLQSKEGKVWLAKMFEKGGVRFDRKANETETDRYILSTFTRMRYCYKDHRLDFKQKGAPTPELQAKGMKPWFACEGRKPLELRIVFGHWSTLGLYKDEHVIAIDTGCVWGGKLTAVRLDDGSETIVQIPCPGALKPTKT
jgi:bis(5'-nucleosyl)-tetraphosphatase (symmetrical)